ncbi:MAG: hypothetical protein AB7K52_04445 [Phycisphaerales bacterium]
MKTHRSLTLTFAWPALALALSMTACEKKAETTSNPAASGGAGSAAKHDDHDHKAGDKHDDHDHDHSDDAALGTVTIGAWTVAVSGEIKAGEEAHLDITLSGATATVSAVRFWVGAQDGKGAMKGKADGAGPEYHAHVEVPNPIPADAKLWIEIEDAQGVKLVGGITLKK